ncbi:glutaredoxin family protein [Candidatus Berkiella cookevillensis]|uniref:Glutaredoxin n=1 Tax=Candidatus Berkiella cookevillensis TaxID=437022 RepID=A0A0Q9YCT7_9GAMM|nr:glutaredoxin family protein [Candidatus Berkiella cookevillensis]MCS5708167.1 glutaredoxin family protein [Candidatus Berkiella cookevillensis]
MSKIFCGVFSPIFLSIILTLSFLSPASAATANIEKTTRDNNEVSIYVASWCSHCRKAKEYLDQLQVTYTLYDIDTPNGQEKFDALHAQGIPIITVGEYRMDGFNAVQLTKVLCQHAVLENCSGAVS